MKAIRVNRHGNGHMLHWLADAAWTECGRQVKHLDVVDELDLAELNPHPEACEVCEALRLNQVRPIPRLAALYLHPSHGRLFTEGPIQHTPKQRLGGKRLR